MIVRINVFTSDSIEHPSLCSRDVLTRVQIADIATSVPVFTWNGYIQHILHPSRKEEIIPLECASVFLVFDYMLHDPGNKQHLHELEEVYLAISNKRRTPTLTQRTQYYVSLIFNKVQSLPHDSRPRVWKNIQRALRVTLDGIHSDSDAQSRSVVQITLYHPC